MSDMIVLPIYFVFVGCPKTDFPFWKIETKPLLCKNKRKKNKNCTKQFISVFKELLLEPVHKCEFQYYRKIFRFVEPQSMCVNFDNFSVLRTLLTNIGFRLDHICTLYSKTWCAIIWITRLNLNLHRIVRQPKYSYCNK